MADTTAMATAGGDTAAITTHTVETVADHNNINGVTAPAAAPAAAHATKPNPPAAAAAAQEEELGDPNVDAEIEAMKKKVKEMEEAAAKIASAQGALADAGTANAAARADGMGGPGQAAVDNSPAVDARSVFIGNVDFSTTPEELKEFFETCGVVNRVTILKDKYSGRPKGHAYVEFADADAIVNALILTETEFKGRPIRVMAKRTNQPRHMRGGRGRGGYRGGYRGGGRGGYRPYYSRGRGRGARYAPY